ncbi:predicted protein [Nematostella vectensis]|uniref:ATP-dependent RNA helicase n=1 Tax=Nematostella vectensis TaxID=45351 RepID=A7SJ72_NEMVE|nr:predicted protein [Nematostella vectensis]|eukprot:XP_001628309.1 predicted protein [Nematostella vectensis]
MDSDDGLMLNLTNFSTEDTKKSAIRTGPKKPFKRKEKGNDYQKSTHRFDFTQGYAISTSNETKNTDNVKVISSLFRHNPAIPEVKRILKKDKKTQQSLENKPLFTGDKFSDLALSSHMVSNLENNVGVSKLTSVQKAAIPTLLAGEDVCIKSKTGSGKTLCYAIPVVQTLQDIVPKIERADGPYAVVLVPTRELALQSFNLLLKLVKPFQWVVPGLVVGGEKRKSEKARLRKGINILVATPGRLLDHIEKTQCLTFRNVQWIVLDEADRLLDMGFEKDVSAILKAIKDQQIKAMHRQAVLLSATLTQGVKQLVSIALSNPQFVSESGLNQQVEKDGSLDESVLAQIPSQLKQYFVIVPSKMRLVSLASFILSKVQESPQNKMIVFLSSRDSVDFHYGLFDKCLGLGAGKKPELYKLHGSMSQTERTDVFTKYSSSQEGILLSTDVAARGLDLPRVSWIIQYDTPGSAVDYVHRVGRTARIGCEGQALLFLTPAEVKYLETLSEFNIRPEELSVSKILQTLTSISSKDVKKSFVRSYATFPASLKHIFHVNNLHLGHVAKAFALRDPPTGISGTTRDSKSVTKKKQ